MSSIRSLFLQAGQSLGRHLDRLRCTFDELRDRVRDAAVQAIGQSVAGAVRDSLRTFLEGVAARPPEIESASWSHSSPAWQQHETLFNDQLDHSYDTDQRGGYENDDLDDEPPPRSPQSEPAEEFPPSRWQQSLAIGCSAVAWQLRRQVHRVSSLATFGLGLASAVGAYVIGPALIVSALSLTAFTESMRAGGALSLSGRS